MTKKLISIEPGDVWVLESEDGKFWWGTDHEGENPGWYQDDQFATCYQERQKERVFLKAGSGVWKRID